MSYSSAELDLEFLRPIILATQPLIPVISKEEYESVANSNVPADDSLFLVPSSKKEECDNCDLSISDWILHPNNVDLALDLLHRWIDSSNLLPLLS